MGTVNARRLSPDIINQITKRLYAQVPFVRIANEFNIHRTTISAVESDMIIKPLRDTARKDERRVALKLATKGLCRYYICSFIGVRYKALFE